MSRSRVRWLAAAVAVVVPLTVLPPPAASAQGVGGDGRSAQRIAADFDGDDKTDLAVWRPSTGEWWVIRSSDGAHLSWRWGEPGDVPVAGDYDGDGRADLAVWRPSTGTWWVRFSRQNYETFDAQQWGQIGDVPLTGDFDGDGKQDLAVVRWSYSPLGETGARWYVRRFNGVHLPGSSRGIRADPGELKPVAADLDGDGKADFVIWSARTGVWHVIGSWHGENLDRQWGAPGDVPAAANFNGDEYDDLAVWRPSTKTWYVRHGGLGTEQTIWLDWGGPNAVPIVGDFDGDHRFGNPRADPGLWEPIGGEWYIPLSSSGYSTAIWFSWGVSGDVPV